MKVDILTYQRETWFSKKNWVAMCQTKLPFDVPKIYAETEEDAFNQMKDKIQALVVWFELHNAATRTLEINVQNNGNLISSYWTGPTLIGKRKRGRAV